MMWFGRTARQNPVWMARTPASVVSAPVRRPSTIYMHRRIGVVGRAWRRGVVHFSTAGSHTRSTARPLAADVAAPLGESCRLARRDPRKFRPLLLPNPGSLTRIGYTVKLAFPDRRDQKQLSELLGRAGLLGHEPPGRARLYTGGVAAHSISTLVSPSVRRVQAAGVSGA
jgi:hypothetical protein